MKHFALDQGEHQSANWLAPDDSFAFRCHADLACFNRCCRNLNLYLYPYDVLRLRKRLGITSDAFLDRYVDVVLREAEYFPQVLLRMADDEQKTCPFLTPAGCSVYPDRPYACRTFPVEQGLMYDAQAQQARVVARFRPPPYCLGQHASQRWQLDSWIADQHAAVYHQMTACWADLRRLFLSDPWGAEGPAGRKAKMAFMATYNMDGFRQFVFSSTFLHRMALKPAVIKKIRRDDAELFKVGLAWVQYFLWGIASPLLQPKR